MREDAWWDRHNQEALSIAVSLQDALGSDISVKRYQVEGWREVDQIANLQRHEPYLRSEKLKLPKRNTLTWILVSRSTISLPTLSSCEVCEELFLF